MPLENPYFVPLNAEGWGIQPIERLPDGGDYHDTLQVNVDGELLEGHTTIRLPDGIDLQLDWKS